MELGKRIVELLVEFLAAAAHHHGRVTTEYDNRRLLLSKKLLRAPVARGCARDAFWHIRFVSGS
jgi:hypothetical protein